MAKFGKKVVVSNNINDYMIGIMAPSGYGKSTLMYRVCDTLFGSDGYLLCDMGDENGVAALHGVVAERVQTWKLFREIVDDIVKNKDTDYANLKVLILDTLDAAFEIAEEYTIKAWNRENMGQKDFRPATSINSVDGGYGRGLDRVIETVKRQINKLNEVGVSVWWSAHVKEKDQTDLFTGNTYTTLTANMSMKYFNSIKNISHVIGFGYFDRTVEKQEIGEENQITKKKKTRNAILDETRKIKFRDSSMIADAKSRFANIVEEIPLDHEEFIKAITDAIAAERVNLPISADKPAVVTPAPVAEKPAKKKADDDTIHIDSAILCKQIRDSFKVASADVKQAVKQILTDAGATALSESLPVDVLVRIKEALEG